jgi:DNA invertase Pin-like site-specific DNA recombinase
MPKPPIIYCRVSSAGQGDDDKVSIPEQLTTCRKIAAANSLPKPVELIDKDKYKSDSGRVVQPSGTRDDRPAFKKMLAMLKSGEADTVIAWAQDRLARGSKVTSVFSEVVEKHKIKVFLVVGQWDIGMAEIMGAVSGFELRRLRDRMRMGKEGRVKRGLHVGRAPVGYITVRDEYGKSINYKFDKRYRKWFDKLASLFLAKTPYNTIAALMPPDPVTGKKIVDASMRYLIRNPFYRGKLDYYNRPSRPRVADFEIIKAKHETAWDAETCQRIELEIKRRLDLERTYNRRRKHKDYIFSGVLRCVYCRRVMSSGFLQSQRDKMVRYPYYRCTSPKLAREGYPFPDHAPNSISERKLIAQLDELLSRLTEGDIVSALESAHDAKAITPDTDRREYLEAKLAELKQGYAAVEAVPSAASAMLAAMDVVEKELAHMTRAEVYEPLPLDTEKALEGFRELKRHCGKLAEVNKAQLSALIFLIFPAIWIQDGQIAKAPQSV